MQMQMQTGHHVLQLWRHYHKLYAHQLAPDYAQLTTPKALIHNKAYENGLFRKLHLEVARFPEQDLQVVHSVAYPRAIYDVPILAFDIVYRREVPVFGIVDACPVTEDVTAKLPYHDELQTLQLHYGFHPTPRKDLPEWGRAIFSTLCVKTRDATELKTFEEYVFAVIALHMAYTTTLKPSADYVRVRAGHARFGENQRKNLVTRAILEKATTREFAEKYMSEVMFDV